MDTYATVQEIRDRGVTTDMATDPEVVTALGRATLLIEAFAGRDFWPHLRTIKVDGSGTDSLFLSDRPLHDFRRLWMEDVEVDKDSYKVYLDEGYIRLYSGTNLPWAPFPGIFPKGAQNVSVRATFGFDPVPDGVKEACIILALKAIKTLRVEAGTSESVVSPDAEVRRVKVDDISVEFDTPGRSYRRQEPIASTGDLNADRLLSRYRIKFFATAV